MIDTKWLSEDERQMLEGHLWYSHAQIYAREFASRLVVERERNRELVRALAQIKTLASEPDSYGVFESEAVCESVVMVVDAALAKNGGKP